MVGSGGSTPGGNTTVVVLLTSTANDQLADFGVSIETLQLLDASGHAVTLYTYNNQTRGAGEFMHLNGTSEPLVIVSVPRGTYTSATMGIDNCGFTTIRFGAPSQGQQNTLITSVYAEGVCNQGTGTATVDLPSPIRVSGNAMALSLNLQVSQSYTLMGVGTNNTTYTVSPVFTLTATPISSHPTNDSNGKVSGVEAEIASVNTAQSTFIANSEDGASLNLDTDSNTMFQGIAGLGSLATNELVDVDFAIQPDGSLLATRVEVNDTSAMGEFTGPWLNYTAMPDVFVLRSQVCFPLPGSAGCDSAVDVTNTTAFGVSGQVTNLQDLPFVPNFNTSDLVLGATFSSYSTGSRDLQGLPYATTVTLEPQTINGTVTAMSSTNGFSVYAVALASYDLIPTLQQYLPLGYPNELTSPSSVVVYADSNTQLLNSGEITTGSLLRFRGLIFNDNGTARMDCQEILDGVTE